MSTLTDSDKRYLEKIFSMRSGYVLNYSDSTFGELFKRYHVQIHGKKYQTYGTSKAKKMRSFWEQESDLIVGQVLSEILKSYETDCDLNDKVPDKTLLEKSYIIINRLLGIKADIAPIQSKDDFLLQEFDIPNIHNLPIEQSVVQIIEKRLDEARKALCAEAYLSVIFLCGSVLEAVLLGAAQKQPINFNKASSSPKDSKGDTKKFHEWSLAQFIDVACDIALLKPDIKKFSHGLRDFRNYIHPYEQMVSGFFLITIQQNYVFKF